MQSSCRRASLFLAASAFLLFCGLDLRGQSAAGEVTGTVTDKSGGAVAVVGFVRPGAADQLVRAVGHVAHLERGARASNHTAT